MRKPVPPKALRTLLQRGTPKVEALRNSTPVALHTRFGDSKYPEQPGSQANTSTTPVRLLLRFLLNNWLRRIDIILFSANRVESN